jgi:hypothetical protein
MGRRALGNSADAMFRGRSWVETKDFHCGGLSLHGTGSALGEPQRSSPESVDGLAGEKDRVGGGLVSCSTRAATLRVSPIKVNSSLPPPPMVPAITTPVLIPMPIRNPGPVPRQTGHWVSSRPPRSPRPPQGPGRPSRRVPCPGRRPDPHRPSSAPRCRGRPCRAHPCP